ncbi:CPXCG motif-containing cysteine-rich protein [Dyella subtropica]|uniref:CPXCG motif-containing cysteine-rich protein n=1 Tax=Dyella subtropica TaxID=2992127 RepID=UPI002258A482|nr:CPXCG motif-containing cysteine-rich protein [Dyella subtropica]
MLSPTHIHCPYCGEAFEILIDSSVESQQYIEDCQVCCCPIVLTVTIDEDGTLQVRAATEDEG